MTKSIIGVDVSKHAIDCYDSSNDNHSRVGMDEVSQWFDKIEKKSDILVICEATGIYSRRLCRKLNEMNIANTEVNPRHVRRFAQACGIIAKNDKIDAKVIARYAKACDVQSTESVELNEELRDVVTRRDQLLNMIQLEQGHAETCDSPIIMKMIDNNIKILKKQISVIEEQLQALINKQPKAEIMLSMPGIGNNTVAALLAYMPEIGKINRGQVAALAGLAPYVRDSGTFKGKRSIYGGRAKVRKPLYMAALVATRHNLKYKQQYQKLIQRGKPFKVAITAIMRNMIVTLNNMVKNSQNWNL